MSLLLRIIITIFLCASPLFTVHAAQPETEKLSATDIRNVENYLNNITTLTANFLQIAPGGEASTGKFFLSRPGKLRWEYTPPVPILIVANGSLITYYDAELKQVSYVSSNSSLAAFLTREHIRFADDVEITHTSKAAGLIRISIIQKGKKEEGELTLICSSEPLSLKKIEVIDASGQLTTVTLSDVHYKTKLDDKLFVLHNLPTFKPHKSQ